MGAPKGNKNALGNKGGRPPIYTLEYCLAEIKLLYERLSGDGKEGKIKYFTLHDLVCDRPYPRQEVSVWRNKYKDELEFSDTIKKIDAELENRLYKLALTNKVNTAVAIFGLKNNYSWKEKQEIEHHDTTPVIQLVKGNPDV